MGELHDRCAAGSSAVSLGWWLEGEDEGGNEGDHHFATLVITGIAVRWEGVGGGSCFFSTPPLWPRTAALN